MATAKRSQRMMGPGHKLVAANITLAIGELIHANPSHILICTLTAIPFSAGRFSPDMDNRGFLQKRLGHRRLLHWWGLPAIVCIPLIYYSVPYVLWGPEIGWISHLFPADFIFGKGGRDIPKGIPLGPFKKSQRLGMGIRVTGKQRNDGTRAKHGTLELLTTILLAVGLTIHIILFVKRQHR